MPRHLGIVFRGTGGIIGQDYVSRTLQACADLVEEVNPNWPATMGGIPVGSAGNPNDLSMQRSVDIALEDAKRIFLERYALNPRIMVVIGGYSAGAVVAAKFREWIQTFYPDNYLCSFSFGDPTRPAGGVYYAGKATPGRGISSWHYGDIRDWRHCWLAAPGDMYTSVPDNATGDIMDTAYDMVTRVQISDPLTTAQAILTRIPEIGFEVLGNIFAGIEAASIAIGFVAQNPPTAPHIQYEFREVWPGQTYLGLAIQHVRDWASRVQPT
ncbi:lysin B [Mycobacterium phage MissWhite]|nr:lysin B [Mycobacterium phage MissWhite]